MLAAVLRNTGDQDLDVTDTIEVNDPGQIGRAHV